MERQPKRSKIDTPTTTTTNTSQASMSHHPVVEIQTILSIQELDDTLFDRFRNLPTSTTSLIDFVEDAFEEFRRSMFTIEELHDVEGHEDHRQPSVHFMDDPDYLSVGEPSRSEEQTESYSWDWTSNSMVKKQMINCSKTQIDKT